MSLQLIIAGLMLGIVSSFHCVGMCGPLALALPVRDLSKIQKSFSLVFYHIGRISVYMCFGLLFGVAGRGLYLAGFQQWFSIGMGLIMIIFLVQYFFFRHFEQPTLVRKFHQNIQKLVMHLWRSPGRKKFILLGMANGLLPCGMVYLAIAGALNTSQVSSGIIFMLLFGLGTLPPLFAISYFGSFINVSIRNKIRQVTPLIVAVMAIVLILRGLNLGIPYLSPLLGSARAPAISCH